MARNLASTRVVNLPASFRLTCVNLVRSFSVLDRPQPHYAGHVPLNVCERGAVAAGSAVMSFLNPRRGGMPGGLSSLGPLVDRSW